MFALVSPILQQAPDFLPNRNSSSRTSAEEKKGWRNSYFEGAIEELELSEMVVVMGMERREYDEAVEKARKKLSEDEEDGVRWRKGFEEEQKLEERIGWFTKMSFPARRSDEPSPTLHYPSSHIFTSTSPPAIPLNHPEKPPTIQQLISVAHQLVELLVDMHSKGEVLHRDISPGNVLHSDGRLKLIDMDNAATINGITSTSEKTPITCTVITMAIELFEDTPPCEHYLGLDLQGVVYYFLLMLDCGLGGSADGDELLFWPQLCFRSNAQRDAIAWARARLWGNSLTASLRKTLLNHLDRLSPELHRVVHLATARLYKQEDQLEFADALLNAFSQDVPETEALKERWWSVPL